jgi:transposase
MFIRPCYRTKDGKRHAYWALVESYRTARGPRQRTVAYLGQIDPSQRRGVKQAAEGGDGRQLDLFEANEADWVVVDAKAVRVERCVDFGGPWLVLALMRRLGMTGFLERVIPAGREEIPWSAMALVLILSRLCRPSSELYIAEHLYKQTAIADLVGVPAEKVNDDRLYRALDKLLPHKEALEAHLKDRLGTLFDLDYDLLLYDVTSTYFEGQAHRNPKAQRGYSRDHRGDCKQICIGLVVTKGGMPLGYEVFAGNRSDVTTVEEIVETIESRYGRADRIWVMDRGMVSDDNIAFLKEGDRRYIVGTPKGMLRHYEQELLSDDWQSVHEGLEVKLCSSPDGDETFILCRSADRRQKEQAMHERFARRIEEGLKTIEAGCAKRKYKVVTIAKRLGKLLGRNSRAAGLFQTDVVQGDDGRAQVVWSKVSAWKDWAQLSEGCYLLRSNIADWSGEDLWKAYIQLTDAEDAFRVHKTDLVLRPIWHHKEDRTDAHVLVCFISYVVWKTLEHLCKQAGLGSSARRVFDELARIKAVDVVLPTQCGVEIRRRCVTRPDDHQAILLQHLDLELPSHLPTSDGKTNEM